MRIRMDFEDGPDGVVVRISSQTERQEQVGSDGVVETSLASITVANLALHLRHLVETTGLRVKVV